MSTEAKWTIFGPKIEKPVANLVPLVLAFFFGAETFFELDAQYSPFMAIFAIGGSAMALRKGIDARAYFGFVPMAISLLWINPLLGGDIFNQMSVLFFLAHAALAMAFATSAYTFWATERKKK